MSIADAADRQSLHNLSKIFAKKRTTHKSFEIIDGRTIYLIVSIPKHGQNLFKRRRMSLMARRFPMHINCFIIIRGWPFLCDWSINDCFPQLAWLVMRKISNYNILIEIMIIYPFCWQWFDLHYDCTLYRTVVRVFRLCAVVCNVQTGGEFHPLFRPANVLIIQSLIFFVYISELQLSLSLSVHCKKLYLLFKTSFVKQKLIHSFILHWTKKWTKLKFIVFSVKIN